MRTSRWNHSLCRFENTPITRTPRALLREIEELAQRHNIKRKPRPPTALQLQVLEALREHEGKKTFGEIAGRLGIRVASLYRIRIELNERGLWKTRPYAPPRKPPERTPEESRRLQQEHAKLLEKAIARHKKLNAPRFHSLIEEAARKAFKRATELWREGDKATFGTYANAAINYHVRRDVCREWIREKETARHTVNGIPDERMRVTRAETTEDAAREAHLAVSRAIELHNAGVISTKYLQALLLREHAGASFPEIGRALGNLTRQRAEQLHKKALKRIAKANGFTRAA